MKKVKLSFLSLLILLVISCLLFVYGCNIYDEAGISDTKSSEACEFEINHALDKGDYDKALELLNSTCKDSLNETSRYMNLAAVYMGKAGYTVPNIIKAMLNASEESEEEPFARFVSAMVKDVSGEKVIYLKEANSYYDKIIGNYSCDNLTEEVPEIVRESCFLKGINNLATAGTTFAILFKSDNESESLTPLIDYWVSSQNQTNGTCNSIDINVNGNPDSADASACAMDFALHGNLTEDTYNSTCDNATIVKDNCNFGYNNKTYYVLKIEIEPKGICIDNATLKTFYKVIEKTNEGNFTVVTDGYAKCDGTPCENLDPANGCYPKPLVLDEATGESATQVGLIVETINQGSEAIASITGNNDTVEAVNDFKKDFCEENPAQCSCYDANGNCHLCNETDDSGVLWLNSSETKDIKIGICNGTETQVTYETQALIIDYLLNQNQ